jgi:hypothetical protein
MELSDSALERRIEVLGLWAGPQHGMAAKAGLSQTWYGYAHSKDESARNCVYARA